MKKLIVLVGLVAVVAIVYSVLFAPVKIVDPTVMGQLSCHERNSGKIINSNIICQSDADCKNWAQANCGPENGCSNWGLECRNSACVEVSYFDPFPSCT